MAFNCACVVTILSVFSVAVISILMVMVVVMSCPNMLMFWLIAVLMETVSPTFRLYLSKTPCALQRLDVSASPTKTRMTGNACLMRLFILLDFDLLLFNGLLD